MLYNHQSGATKHSAESALESESEAKRGKYDTEIFQPSEVPPQFNGYHGSQLTTRNPPANIVPFDLSLWNNAFAVNANETAYSGWYNFGPLYDFDFFGCDHTMMDGGAFGHTGGGVVNMDSDTNTPDLLNRPATPLATPTTRPMVFELRLDESRPTDLLTIRIIQGM